MADAIERLESWKCGHRARSVKIEKDNGYGASCWIVELCHEKGQTQAYEAQFMGYGHDPEDQVRFITQALKLGTVFVDWGEGDWPGLGRTIHEAIDAFEAGIWGCPIPEETK